MSLKSLLATKLPKKAQKFIPSSFDILGSKEKAVAIVEIRPELRKYAPKIAHAIMDLHKNVLTVLEKGTPRKGVFRIRDYKILAGDPNTEVLHVESGCRFKLDPRVVYFSQREGTERMRIALMVKNNEKVMVFFAGAGPFAIVISKKAKAKKIVGIEINPCAAKYFRENVILNKCRNIDVVEGDASVLSKKYKNFDRLLMPLPERSLEFLPEAIGCMKQGGIIHIYLFSTDDDLAKHKSKIRSVARKAGRKISFQGKTNVLPYGPGIWKMRLDVRIN